MRLTFQLIINYNRKSRQPLNMSKEIEEIQYFNDIATVLKILKKTIATLELILCTEQYNTDASSLIYKISEQSKILLEICRRQKNRNHQAFIINNEKMKVRIRQWITDCRGKYVNGYQYKDIRSFLQQLQIAFGIFQKNQDFVTLITKIYNIIADQLRIFKIKYDLFHQKNPLNADYQYQKVRKTKSLILSPNFVVCSQSTNISVLYGLQIDYSHLKSSIILCKKNQIEFLQCQLQRNRDISKQIDSYMKEYYLQKNRLRIKRKHHSQLYSRQIKSSIKNLRVKTTANQKLYHNFDKESKRGSTKQNRQEQSSNKLVYKINNVYVSGNEFDIYSDQASNVFNPNRGKKRGPAFLTRAIRDPLVNRINQFNSKQFIN